MLPRCAILLTALCTLAFAQTPTAPAIPGTLGDKVAIVGDMVQFWMGPTGSQPFTYQWLKNGAPLANGGSILGATDQVLQISNVQRGDDAMYSLRVTNSAGTATSNAAHLTVRELRIVAQPANQSVSPGGTATFSVGVSATDPITYQWYKNNDPIAGATGSSLTIANAAATDVANYSASVRTVVNTIYSNSASLSVAAAPIIGAQPVNTSTLVGNGFNVFVAAIGQGPFTYQWFKNGSVLPGATAASFVTSSAQLSDAGDYYAVVSNPSGSVTSATAKVTVFGITISGATQKTYDGTPLTVTAISDPPGLPVKITYTYWNTGSALSGPPVAAGFYRAVASVSQPPYFGGTSVDLTIKAVPLTVTFGNLQQTYDGNPHPVTATTTPAGVPIKLEYGGPNGPPPIAAGAYEVIAYSQDSNLMPTTTAKATLVVAKASQSVTVDAPPVNAQVGTAFALTATASSGLSPVTFSVVSGNAMLSGSSLTVNDANPVTIRATQAGNGNYNAATADFTFSLGKQSQTISFPPLANRLTSAAPEPITATASSGLPVTLSVVSGPATISGNTLTLTGTAGTVVVRATQAGTSSYNPAPVVDRSFAVTASSAPVITIQPVSQTATVYTDVTFTVGATGTGPLSYQWLKSGRQVAGVNAPTFTLRNAQISDSGTIAVIVSDGDASTTSATATLTVVPGQNPSAIPPAIINQTASQTLNAGAVADIGVTAGGTPPIYYEWRKDGTPIAGATLSTYVILNFQAADAGNYTVVVQNSAGAITSPATTLSLAAPSNNGAPTITNQPSSQLVATGSSTFLAVTASGTGPFSYQWYKEGTAIAGATQDQLNFFSGAKPSDAGSYSVSVSNASGSVMSATATISVSDPVTITSQPTSRTAAEGSSVSFSVEVAGTPPFSYTWLKNGSLIPGAASSTFTIQNVQPSDAGSYSAEVFNYGGSRHSDVVTLTVTPAAPPPPANLPATTAPTTNTPPVVAPPIVTAPVLTTPPTDPPASVAPTLVVTPPAVTTPIAPAPGDTTPAVVVPPTSTPPPVVTPPSGTIPSAPTPAVGTPPVVTTPPIVTPPIATPPVVGPPISTPPIITPPSIVTPPVAPVSPPTGTTGPVPTTPGPGPSLAPTSRLVNLSVRSMAGTGDAALAVGFVTSGTGTKQVLLRGIGPTLAQFSVNGALTRPELQLFDANEQLMQRNSGWGGTAALTDAFARVGAFALPPTSSDAALLVPLAVGQNTVEVDGAAGTRGVALIEAYDADGATPSARFINMSARTVSGTGAEALTIGFVVSGNAPVTVLIRGIGPSLASFGVSGVLPDPQLTVFTGDTVVASNNDWAGTDELTAAFIRVGAFSIAGNSKDAAVLVTLNPGAYTARVTDVAGRTGVALIEVYEVR